MNANEDTEVMGLVRLRDAEDRRKMQRLEEIRFTLTSKRKLIVEVKWGLQQPQMVKISSQHFQKSGKH